jgi:hypothetical protein
VKLYSTPEAIARGEPSLLAILETLLAMSLYVILALRQNTLLHLAIAAAAAPLVLIRTEYATLRAFYLYARNLSFPEDTTHPPGPRRPTPFFQVRTLGWLAERIFMLLFTVVLATVGGAGLAVTLILVKARANLEALIRNPLDGLKAIPGNWKKQVLCVDMAHPPELLPGIENAPPELDVLKFRSTLNRFWSGASADPIMTVGFVPMLLLQYLPAIIYRFSLKGTALVWSPLLWLIHTGLDRSLPLRVRLEYLCTADLPRFQRYYSALLLIMFGAKVYLFVAWMQLAHVWRALPGARTFEQFVVPAGIPPWQIAAALNAISTWAVYFVAEWYLILIRHRIPVYESTLDRGLRAGSVVRGLLALYTIACTIYIVVRASSAWELPPLETKLFPWQ